MLPVQSLEGLEVFYQDPVWQVSLLHLNVGEAWQRPGSICAGETRLRRQLGRFQSWEGAAQTLLTQELLILLQLS